MHRLDRVERPENTPAMQSSGDLLVEGVLVKTYVDALFMSTVPPRRPPELHALADVQRH
jgi:hypothetical protein